MMMQTIQNQTDPAYLDPNNPNASGTGIFAVADLSSDAPDAVSAFYVEDITYEQTLNRGALAIAFKWVPGNWGIVRQANCPPWCIGTCPPLTGCICVNGRCVKPTSSLP